MDKKINFIVIIIALSMVSSFDPENSYCLTPRCARGLHTMCVYNETEPDAKCNRVVRSGLTNNEREKILDVHNELRSRVFNGEETRGSPGPQPPAMYESMLEWNYELENIAQRWANQCYSFGDTCRHIDDYLVGQNVITSDFDEDMDEELQLNNLEELIHYWYNQVERFHKRSVNRFRMRKARNRSTLAYSQIVWGETIYLGCGVMRYHKTRHPVPKIFLACNYAPSGNREGYPVYERL